MPLEASKLPSGLLPVVFFVGPFQVWNFDGDVSGSAVGCNEDQVYEQWESYLTGGVGPWANKKTCQGTPKWKKEKWGRAGGQG